MVSERTAAMMQRIHIGTSGWNYRHWKGVFYPDQLIHSQWLGYYLRYFETVEINNTFYQLPGKRVFRDWYETAPAGFIFSVKASRTITHMKKLKEPARPVQMLMDHVAVLNDKLGPVLFQLPPRWKYNPDRLSHFLEILPDNFRYAFEFRDDSWWNPAMAGMLAEKNAAFCIFELAGKRSPEWVTADFVYIRLHGPGNAYEGSYSDRVLTAWADSISKWQGEGLSVYCYFDNDQQAFAVRNAENLKRMTAANRDNLIHKSNSADF
jgi:uncharacterized protein YecE (DUF72 family)